jgi:ABC-type multidrug transport system fused ATPase/permease subunit
MDATGRFSLALSYYGRLCRKVLADRFLLLTFLVAAALHAGGHAMTAVVAGLLGRALVSDTAHISSTFRFLSNPATLAFVGVVATLLKATGATLGATAQSRLAQKVATRVRHTVAERLLGGGSTLATGHLSARLAVRVREVETAVHEGVLGGIRAALALAPLALALALLSSKLALAALALLAPFAGCVALARRAWRQSSERVLELAEGLEQEMSELVDHIDVWRTYGAGGKVLGALDALGARASQVSSKAEGARAALSSANEVLAALALLLCVWAARAFSFPLGDGTLIAFAVVFFMAYRPLRDLGDARSALERGAEALSVLESVAEFAGERRAGAPIAWPLEPLVVDSVGVRRTAIVGSSSFHGALSSFTARPGDMVAIVGPNGSGKTTLLRALLGLEASAVGKARYGSRDLTRRGVGPSERPFAWLAQDAPILAGNLEDNVMLAGADREKMLGALELVGAGKIAREWRDDRLGATGRPVSGGERKWIALARAIATGLPVLLLDEPTAGLDVESRMVVLGALEKLRGERTILVVSHDPGLIHAADLVVEVGSELGEKTRVVFEHQANVRNVVAQHGHALDPDAEGEARVALGVDSGVFEDDGVDHSAT